MSFTQYKTLFKEYINKELKIPNFNLEITNDLYMRMSRSDFDNNKTIAATLNYGTPSVQKFSNYFKVVNTSVQLMAYVPLSKRNEIAEEIDNFFDKNYKLSISISTSTARGIFCSFAFDGCTCDGIVREINGIKSVMIQALGTISFVNNFQVYNLPLNGFNTLKFYNANTSQYVEITSIIKEERESYSNVDTQVCMNERYGVQTIINVGYMYRATILCLGNIETEWLREMLVCEKAPTRMRVIFGGSTKEKNCIVRLTDSLDIGNFPTITLTINL